MIQSGGFRFRVDLRSTGRGEWTVCSTVCSTLGLIDTWCCSIRGLVQSPCGKISVIMTFGGGEGVLVRDVLQLHCQQILVVIIHSCG